MQSETENSNINQSQPNTPINNHPEETKIDFPAHNISIEQEDTNIDLFSPNTLLTNGLIKLDTSLGIVGYAMQYIQPHSLFIVGTKDGCLLIYDPINFFLIEKLTNVHSDKWIISLYYCKALDLLFTTSTDRTIKVFKFNNSQGLEERAKMEGHKDSVNGILYIPEQNVLVSIGRDPNLKVWDAKSFTLKGEIETQGGGMGCLIIRMEELLDCVGVSFASGKIKFFNIVSGECVLCIETNSGNSNYYINSLLYLPQRKWIVAQISANQIKIWEKGQEGWNERGVIKTEGHANYVWIDEKEETLVCACDKPFLDVFDLGSLLRKNKILFAQTPLKNSNGLVYIKSLCKVVVSAWNSPHLYILKIAE